MGEVIDRVHCHLVQSTHVVDCGLEWLIIHLVQLVLLYVQIRLFSSCYFTSPPSVTLIQYKIRVG